MLRGFEILKTRSPENNINVRELEEKYNFNLPPLYKLFIQTFLVDENLFKSELYFVPIKNDYYGWGGRYYEPNQNLAVEWFLKLENSYEVFFQTDLSRIERKQKYLPIGGLAGNTGLHVGTINEEKDQLFAIDYDSNTAKFICQNIFEYIRGLVLKPVPEDYLILGIKYQNLYKKWGEDFWRIKE